MKNKRSGIEFDHMEFIFRNATVNAWRLLKGILVYVLGTFTVAVLVYVAFALIFSTDSEKRMKREIRMYQQIYSTLTPKQELVGDALANLEYKDDELYNLVFHTGAPAADPLEGSGIVFASDTIPDSRLLSYTAAKADALLSKADSVEAAFLKAVETLSAESSVLPPMSLPVKDITYAQVGASTGRKINPFYKAYVFHTGIDLIVPRGTPVYAPADGTVSVASGSRNVGNVVRIEHQGGYETGFYHLESISVRKGQKVRRGDKVGTVGMSGKAYAPHLHYEILKDGVNVDPVHYIFASVSPEDYANMLYMSVNTLQSMD